MRWALLLFGCSTFHFERAVTPSGVPCPDLALFPAGATVDKPLHRLRPIHSAWECRTEAERIESLRREACRAGGDAAIDAANEEVRSDRGVPVTVASGTAVIWK